VVDTVECDDGNACTTQECNPSNGQCIVVDTVECDDGNACTTQECNPSNGQCIVVDTVECDDDNACTTQECNPSNGQCIVVDTVECDDDNACTTQECNPGNGQCLVVDTVECDDGNACTTQECNPANGQCVVVDTVECDDNNACTTQQCNPDTGQCQVINTVECDDDNDCTTDVCNPQTGQCEFTDIGTCGDGEQCNFEGCRPIDHPTAPCTCCGDGIVQGGAGETCDPPGSTTDSGNICRNDCTFCGDGNLDDGEECDEGNGNSDLPGSTCTTDCIQPCFEKPVITCPDDVFAHTNNQCEASINPGTPDVSDPCISVSQLIVSHVAIGPDGGPGPFPNCLEELDLECGPSQQQPCWDLNGNGVCSMGGGPGTGEDINGDGQCTVADCECICLLPDDTTPQELPPQFGSDDGGCFDADTEQCPPLPTTCDENADGVYPVGTTTIVWTVYNPVSQLRAQCEQKVWVGDDDAPILECVGHESFIETFCGDDSICKSDLVDQLVCPEHSATPLHATDNCKKACPEFPGDPDVLDWEIILVQNGVEKEITDSNCLDLGVHWLRIRAKDCAKEHDPETGGEFSDPNFSDTACDVLAVVIIGLECPGGGGGGSGGSNTNGNDNSNSNANSNGNSNDNSSGNNTAGGGGGGGGAPPPPVVIVPPPPDGEAEEPAEEEEVVDVGGPDDDVVEEEPPAEEEPQRADGQEEDAGRDEPKDGEQSPNAQHRPPMPAENTASSPENGDTSASTSGFCGAGGSSSLMLLLAMTLMRIRLWRSRPQIGDTQT
jgi:hypothetical protein